MRSDSKPVQPDPLTALVSIEMLLYIWNLRTKKFMIVLKHLTTFDREDFGEQINLCSLCRNYFGAR